MKSIVTRNYLIPFALVASLFFCWGFAHSILDVLNKHFQNMLEISKTRSALVQAMVYGGYFIMAIPAGVIIRQWGYKSGVITGLILYGIGALLFVPGERMMSFEFFLFCLFIIGCGLTCLETAANPYVTVLGEPETAASRLNLAQSLNGLGWIVGPLVGGLIIFGDSGSVALPYAVIGIAVLVIAVLFSRMQLPEIVDTSTSEKAGIDKLSKSESYLFGLVALFAYVAAQTGVNSFFINYVTETSCTITNQQAALMLSFGGMGFFLVGRLLGTWLMNYLSAPRLLLICALGAILCMIGVIYGGTIGLISLLVTYLFESIMFTTIFALALQGLSTSATKRGSSYLIMTIVGGAIAPMLMGYIGENNMAIGFIIPLVCYLVVATYAKKIKKTYE